MSAPVLPAASLAVTVMTLIPLGKRNVTGAPVISPATNVAPTPIVGPVHLGDTHVI